MLASEGVMGKAERHWTQVRMDLEGTPDAFSSPLALETVCCTSSVRLLGPEGTSSLNSLRLGPSLSGRSPWQRALGYRAGVFMVWMCQ